MAKHKILTICAEIFIRSVLKYLPGTGFKIMQGQVGMDETRLTIGQPLKPLKLGDTYIVFTLVSILFLFILHKKKL